MKTYFVNRLHIIHLHDVVEAKDEIKALEIFKQNIINGEYNEPSVSENFSVEEFDDEDEEIEPEKLIEIKNTMSLDEIFDVLRERRKVAC